jgi:hypothetical protein
MRGVRAWGERIGLWVEAVTEPVVPTVEAGFRRVNAWRERIDARVDATAAGSFGLWLRYFAAAVTVTGVVVVALHLLLLATFGSGSWLRWLGVAVVGLVALALEATVVRNVLISIAEPSQRRSLLIAFLTSLAVLLISVEAFAAAAAAIAGGRVDLWPAEQLYLWHLVDSVPLLAIPQRLAWTQPALLTHVGGRLLVLGFKVAVIAPLVRLVMAFYDLVESQGGERRQAVLRAGAGSRTSISFFRSVKSPRVGFVVPVVVVAGLAYGGLGPGTDAGRHIASLSGAVLLGTLLALVVGALVTAVGVAALTVMAVDRWWAVAAEFSEPVAFVVALGLVWLDTPVRLAPFPVGVAGFELGKVGTTIVVWAVLFTLVETVDSFPELPETILALSLVLTFAGTHAPGWVFLTNHVHWTPWGFATGHAIVAAGLGLTGAYLLYLVSKMSTRVRKAGHINALDPNAAVRTQVAGYLLMCAQIVIAAAALLMLLQQFGTVSPAPGSSRLAAQDSLIAVTWHVLDALPGPDIPGVLGWRLTSDFTGRWAGLVIILAVVSTLVIVAFPMARAILQWAKLKAARPRPEQASAIVPAAVLHDLETVLAYLIKPADTNTPADNQTPGRSPRRPRYQPKITRSPVVEHRLIDVELARRTLLDLLGPDAPMYQAADQAINATAEAYRTAVTMSPWALRSMVELRSSLDRTFPRREESEAKARAALDAYRPLATVADGPATADRHPTRRPGTRRRNPPQSRSCAADDPLRLRPGTRP